MPFHPDGGQLRVTFNSKEYPTSQGVVLCLDYDSFVIWLDVELLNGPVVIRRLQHVRARGQFPASRASYIDVTGKDIKL